MKNRAAVIWVSGIIILLLYVCFVLVFDSYKSNPVLETTSDQVILGQEELRLYARSAVLMDADSGRILYGKNEDEPMAMASTTKIMTLIVALELEGSKDMEKEIVNVSSYAASQPKVHLGMKAGEQYYLEDLYYSLMLESHNDTAVCIAEHFGNRFLGREWSDNGTEESKKAVDAFINEMNKKAKELKLKNTFFVTPNGLDGAKTLEDGTVKEHQTTAAELAGILRYCIETSPAREAFLSITQTGSRIFKNVEGNRTFTCTNHNSFLQMMEGALTGKTGFTSKAGYCYVGALRQDERTFIVSLLACGWPNNKNYKWIDTRKLMNYGLNNYEYRDVYQKDFLFDPVPAADGISKNGDWTKQAYVPIGIVLPEEQKHLNVLLRKDEMIDIEYKGTDFFQAPVSKGEVAGYLTYRLEDTILAEYPVTALMDVEKLDFSWCFRTVTGKYVPQIP